MGFKCNNTVETCIKKYNNKTYATEAMEFLLNWGDQKGSELSTYCETNSC
jgi:hypothetical protein